MEPVFLPWVLVGLLCSNCLANSGTGFLVGPFNLETHILLLGTFFLNELLETSLSSVQFSP